MRWRNFSIPLRGVRVRFTVDGVVEDLALDPATLAVPRVEEVLPAGRDYRFDQGLLDRTPRQVAAQIILDRGEIVARQPTAELGFEGVPPRPYCAETVWSVRDVHAVTVEVEPFGHPERVQTYTVVSPPGAEAVVEITNECDHTPVPGEPGDPDFRWHFEALRESDKADWRAKLQGAGAKLPFPKPPAAVYVVDPPCASALWPAAAF